jgi:Flp pilus assembly protein TadD
MCRKHAFAATALLVLMVAGQASALPWGKRDKAAPPAAAAAKPQAKPAAEAPAPKATPQERAVAERMDPLARAAFWAREVNIDPADAEASVRMASALRAIGRLNEAQQAVQRVLVLQPDNIEALLESGRIYLAQEQGFYAIEPARRAQALQPRDWRAASMLAVALEQAQRDNEALAAHRQALAIAPANPVVMSNAAMFYAGHGDLKAAEALLRQAAADPAAAIQVRQNLALVLGLQGKLAEAEQLVRRDLPPAMAANNLAYLRAAAGASTARNWDSLRQPSAQ